MDYTTIGITVLWTFLFLYIIVVQLTLVQVSLPYTQN